MQKKKNLQKKIAKKICITLIFRKKKKFEKKIANTKFCLENLHEKMCKKIIFVKIKILHEKICIIFIVHKIPSVIRANSCHLTSDWLWGR